MEKIALSAVARNIGKTENAKLRAEGLIPAVIYGGKDNVNVAIDAREFDRQFHVVSENTIVELTVEKKKFQVLIKAYQKNWLKGKMLHIDFLEITEGKELKTNVPVRIIGAGKSVGEKAGGLLEVFVHEMGVSCLPKNLPSEIVVDIMELELGSSIHVSQVVLPTGVKTSASADQVVVAIDHAVKAEVASTDDEETAITEEVVAE